MPFICSYSYGTISYICKKSASPCELKPISDNSPEILMIGPEAGSRVTSPDCRNSYRAASQLAVLGLPSVALHAYFTLTGMGVGGPTGYCHHRGWSWPIKESRMLSSPLSILARLFCNVIVRDLRNWLSALISTIRECSAQVHRESLLSNHCQRNGIVSCFRIQQERRTGNCYRHVVRYI